MKIPIQLYSVGWIVLHIYSHVKKEGSNFWSSIDGPILQSINKWWSNCWGPTWSQKEFACYTYVTVDLCLRYIFFMFFFLIWFVTFALAIWLLRMRDIFAILGTWTFSIMLMAKGSQWKSHNFKVFKLYSISQVDICHTSWPIPVHIFCIDNLQFLDFWCLMCYCPIRIIYIWSVLQSTAHVTRLPRTWSSMLSLNWKKLQSRKNEMVDR